MQRDASFRDDFGGSFGIFVARRGGWQINFNRPCYVTGIQLYVMLCLWVPPCVQGILLLGMFALVLLVIGELQPLITIKLSQATLKHGAHWLLSLLGPLLCPCLLLTCLLYTSPSPRDQRGSRMPSSA